jgi:hypothetical protein
MTMIYDPITDLNILLCAVIAILGFCGYSRNKNSLLLYFGTAFTLFGFSHLLTLFGQRQTLVAIMIGLRITAYLIVILVLTRLLLKK